MPASIHPTSFVDPTARLADGVRVGPHSIVGPNVTIGEDTELRSHVVIERNTRIGRQNVIYQFTAIGGDPQDRKYGGEETWCEIGDRNQLRECVTVHRGTGNGGGITRIGSDNLIMGSAHVAHDCVIGNRVTIANAVLLAGHVWIGDLASIGGAAGVHHFVSLHRMCFVAGMTRVERDVPPFLVCEGQPARPRAANKVLLERCGLAPTTIRALRLCCRRIFGRRTQHLGISIEDRLNGLCAEFVAIPEVAEFCDVVRHINLCEKGRVREQRRADDKRRAAGAVPAG